MKLPRQGTRRFRVLRCFIGKTMNVTEVMTSFGLFGFETRSHLATELRALADLEYLHHSKGVYRLKPEVQSALEELKLEEIAIVPPRTYNVFTAPPISKKHIPSLEPRRPNCLDVRVPSRYVASDPIPFGESE